jgi:isopentenyl diphosphate isomerase/L-lactate dehydrogenase-like FMN-dependent dehydrogenase
LSVEDAEAAVEAGASSIVVSNHGGRTIDSLPATINVLPEICKAVKKYIPVLVDGGFRTGEDILKALAFGASGVLIGRPVIVYAVGGGIKGVEFYLNNLKSNLEKSMLLTGVSEISEISEKIIANL